MVRPFLGIVAALALLLGACSSDSEPPTDPSAFCTQLRLATGPAGALDDLVLDDPASVEAALDEVRRLEQLATTEVRDDVVIMVESFSDLTEALAAADPDARRDVLAELADSIEAGAAASERVNNFSTSNCGVDLSDAVTTTTTTSTIPIEAPPD